MEGNVANLLGMARTAQMGGNQEEALTYFNRVLEIDPQVSDAWVGKGKAAGWQSTMVNIRLPEALVAFGHAIATAPEERKGAVTKEVADEVNKIVVALYSLARNHLVEFASLENTWPSYIAQVAQLIDALEETRKWDPLNRQTLENVVHLCKDNIEGYSYRDQFNNNAPGLLYLQPHYEQLMRNRMDQATEALRSIDPSYAPPAIEKKTQDSCFVVTATMGDFDHPDVVLLRRFRDEWIMRLPAGKSLVGIYYRVGPTLASFIAGSARRRAWSYRMIVKPAARFARNRLAGRG